jgi:hypothetical protein
MIILLSEEMLGVVDVTSVLLSFLLTTVNWLCSTAVNVVKKIQNFCWQPLFMNTVPASPEMAIVPGSLTSNSFVKSLTSVSAAIGIFTKLLEQGCDCGDLQLVAAHDLKAAATAGRNRDRRHGSTGSNYNILANNPVIQGAFILVVADSYKL